MAVKISLTDIFQAMSERKTVSSIMFEFIKNVFMEAAKHTVSFYFEPWIAEKTCQYLLLKTGVCLPHCKMIYQQFLYLQDMRSFFVSRMLTKQQNGNRVQTKIKD